MVAGNLKRKKKKKKTGDLTMLYIPNGKMFIRISGILNINTKCIRKEGGIYTHVESELVWLP